MDVQEDTSLRSTICSIRRYMCNRRTIHGTPLESERKMEGTEKRMLHPQKIVRSECTLLRSTTCSIHRYMCNRRRIHGTPLESERKMEGTEKRMLHHQRRGV